MYFTIAKSIRLLFLAKQIIMNMNNREHNVHLCVVSFIATSYLVSAWIKAF